MVFSSFHAPSPSLIESPTHARARTNARSLSLYLFLSLDSLSRERERARASRRACLFCVSVLRFSWRAEAAFPCQHHVAAGIASLTPPASVASRAPPSRRRAPRQRATSALFPSLETTFGLCVFFVLQILPKNTESRWIKRERETLERGVFPVFFLFSLRVFPLRRTARAIYMLASDALRDLTNARLPRRTMAAMLTTGRRSSRPTWPL